MHRRLLAALGLLGTTLYVFPLVLHHPLIDPDEGLHAAIAQAMVEGGDYVTPRFLGEPFPDKPVLFFWALAGSLWAFGFTEAAARAPGLLFGLLGAVTTGLLAGTILGRRGGWLAGVFYATLSLPIGLMQLPVHDLALVPFTNGALLAFWRGARSPRTLRVLAWSLLAGVCLGGAILTKGLSGVAIVGLAHATVLLIERRLRAAVIAGGALALMIGVAVAAPWFVAMEHAHPGYLDYYLLKRHVLGFTTETQRHGKSPWHYYLPVVLGGGLPWILYAPFATAGRRPRGSDPATEEPSHRRDAARVELAADGNRVSEPFEFKAAHVCPPAVPGHRAPRGGRVARLAAAIAATTPRAGSAGCRRCRQRSAHSSCRRRSCSRPRSSRCRMSGGCGWWPPPLPQDGGWPHVSCRDTPRWRRRSARR